MEAIVVIVAVVVVILLAIRYLSSVPSEAAKNESEQRAQRHVEDDIVPLVGLGVMGGDLLDGEAPIDGDDQNSALPDDKGYEDELMDD